MYVCMYNYAGRLCSVWVSSVAVWTELTEGHSGGRAVACDRSTVQEHLHIVLRALLQSLREGYIDTVSISVVISVGELCCLFNV